MDRHLLVSGGSRGIGAAIVRGAVSRGYSVSFSYSRDAENADALAAEQTANGQRVQALQTDAGAAAPSLFDRAEMGFGPVDLLVNNAGITGPLGSFLYSDEETARRVFDVNVHGTMSYSRFAVLPSRAPGRPAAASHVHEGTDEFGTHR